MRGQFSGNNAASDIEKERFCTNFLCLELFQSRNRNCTKSLRFYNTAYDQPSHGSAGVVSGLPASSPLYQVSIKPFLRFCLSAGTVMMPLQSIQWEIRILISILFFLRTIFSTVHLPPLRFHCADGCWDRTQDRCNWCIGSQTL
jgi:hypothetical protein